MSNESIEPQPNRKPVISILIKVDWALWTALLILSLYMLIRMATERSGPEGRGLGAFAVVIIVALLAGAAAAVNAAARKQSPTGLITMAVLLVWPLVFLIADSVIKARKS